MIRNHFIDTDFVWNGQKINKEPINELLQLTSSSELSIACKITPDHLNFKNAGRQKVKTAAQLLFHTTSQAIKRCVSLGKMSSENALVCVDFIKIVNDWFDVFNSKMPAIDSRDRMKAYGLVINLQNEMFNLRAPNKKVLLPFQKGILISNSSLSQLFDYLKEKYEVQFILTYRLNQDIVENFFSAIRAKGGLHDHPSALEFKYRLRSYSNLLGILFSVM